MSGVGKEMPPFSSPPLVPPIGETAWRPEDRGTGKGSSLRYEGNREYPEGAQGILGK